MGRDPREYFKVEADINYTRGETVSFKPGFWFLLKWGWIQFFAIYIIISYLTNQIMSIVYANQLISTIVDQKPKQFVNDDEYK